MTNNFQIGQKIYSGKNDDYFTQLKIEGIAEQIVAVADEQFSFNYYDPCIYPLSDNNSRTSFEVNKFYYLRFFVRRTDRQWDNVYIKLYKSEDEQAASYKIKTVTIPKVVHINDEDSVYMVEALFTPPDDGYNKIRIETDRTTSDMSLERPLTYIDEIIYENIYGDKQGTLSYKQNSRGSIQLDFSNQDTVAPSLNFTYSENGIVYESQNNFIYTMSYSQDELKTPQQLLIKYGEKDIVIPLQLQKTSESTDDEVMLIDDEPVVHDLRTDWVEDSKTGNFQGYWLPIHYYKNDGTPPPQKYLDYNIVLLEVKTLLPESTSGATDSNQYAYCKIGLQAQPNTIFTFDGEELRVGPTGIYQIEYNDLQISRIGIVPSNLKEANENNFFILDYKRRLLTSTKTEDDSSSGSGEGSNQPDNSANTPTEITRI